MLHVIQGHERDLPQNAKLIDSMHQFRARAFKDRRGWRVEVRNGRETDFFDEQDPLYIIVSDGMEGHVASLRLLPTTAATTLRKSDPPLVIDGPFAETKEQLLGFYIIDVADLDEALGIARELGEANPGGAYEIRPLALYNAGAPLSASVA